MKKIIYDLGCHNGSNIQIEGTSKNVLDIICDYGEPFYIKIDLEHYDHIILREVLNNRIFPKYISVESHNLEVFNLITSHEKYSFFKLLKGDDLHLKQYQIKDLSGLEINYQLPAHSAGPFEDDIKGNWLSKDIFKLEFF